MRLWVWFLNCLNMTEFGWIAPALAANPSAPEGLLLRLAESHDEQTQLALIKARRYAAMSLPLATTTPALIRPSTMQGPSVPALKLQKPSCMTVVPGAR